MSSREIAELTGKRHDHVLRDIDNLLAELGETSPQLWGHLPDAYGRPQRVALLPKDLTITLVAGYSAPLRHRIVTRWMELEEAQAGPKLPNFNNPAEAARAWARRSWQALNPEPQRRAKPWVLQRGAPPLPRSHPIGIPRGFLVVAL